MFAVAALDPVLQFVFFLVAIVLFAVCHFTGRFGWLGLGAFAVPFAWNALAAS